MGVDLESEEFAIWISAIKTICPFFTSLAMFAEHEFNDDIPTQATPEAVLEVFASMNIKSQNDIKKAVSKEKDVDLAEKIARQLFGKVKNQKTKLEDGTVKEEEVYIPTDLDADQVQKIWEVLQDKKREREAHDKASADAQKKTSEDNDVISRMESALAS